MDDHDHREPIRGRVGRGESSPFIRFFLFFCAFNYMRAWKNNYTLNDVPTPASLPLIFLLLLNHDALSNNRSGIRKTV